MNIKFGLIDYNDICFERKTLQLEMECLSNDAILDECNFVISGEFESEMMEDVLVSYFKSGTINSEQRKIAEGLYLLAHGELCWEV